MSEHPKPLAVFALSYNSFDDLTAFEAISRIVDVVFVSDRQALFDSMRNPACFTVFVDREFNSSAIELLAGELKIRGLPWTLLVERVNAADQEFFARISVDEILAKPVNGTLLASRCRLMLNRYLEARDFPVPVQLPPDINIRGLRQQRRERDALDSRRVVTVAKTPAPKAQTFTGALKSIESPPTTPAQILDIVRTRVQEIRHRTDWDKELWPSQSLPPQTDQEQLFKTGFHQINEELGQLFRDCCFSLGAERITLISIRPDYVEAEQVFAEHLLAIISSEPSVAQYPSIPSILFPQIQVAVEKKSTVVLNEPMPEHVTAHHRPDAWKLGGRIEEASAVVPLLSANRRVYAVLLLQFGTVCDAETLANLEQAAAFLGVPKLHYRHVDFLGRVYGGKG